MCCIERKIESFLRISVIGMENFMEKEEQIRRWRLILGQESDKRFSDMGGGDLNAEQDLMDQALSLIHI